MSLSKRCYSIIGNIILNNKFSQGVMNINF